MSDRCSKCGEVRLLGAEHSCAAVTAACEVCGRPKGPPGDWDESEFICWNDRHCHRLGCEREKAANKDLKLTLIDIAEQVTARDAK